MTAFYAFDSESEFNSLEKIKGTQFDIIGFTIVGSEEETDEEGNTIEVPIYGSKYLVNTLKPVEGWEQYEAFPNTPLRIFG